MNNSMANNDLKISQMPLVDNVEAGDIIPIVRDGENMAVDATNLQGGGIGNLGDPVEDIEEGDKIPLVRNGQTLSLDGMAIANLGQMAFDTETAVNEVKADVETLRTDMSNTVLDLGGRINEKQDAFTTSEDLQMADNVLSLTDMAKKRLFIDMWNTACGTTGRYNSETGFFELNGLTDITYEEAVQIYNVGMISSRYNGCAAYNQTTIRTNLPPKVDAGVQSYERTFQGCSNMEIANAMMMYDGNNTFSGCTKLKKIIRYHGIRDNGLKANIFEGCLTLSEITGFHFSSITKDSTVDLRYVPKLDRPTLSSLINSKNLDSWMQYENTIVVHADVYAKLTGDTTNEAAAALTPEELAQWQQVVMDAAEKNISFIEATT